MQRKRKGIVNYQKYDASCTLTTLQVSDIKNYKCLIFVAEHMLICHLLARPLSLHSHVSPIFQL
jgi:hypothetical protein